MKTQQYFWRKKESWSPSFSEKTSSQSPQIIFIFGGRKQLEDGGALEELKTAFPNSIFVGCSTAGEIYKTSVYDNSVTATCLFLEKTKIAHNEIDIKNFEESFDAGISLIKKFDAEGLKHIFVISDGLCVNGSELVAGMRMALPPNINITGGLAGDGADFEKTLVISRDGSSREGLISAVGFYGVEVRYGSFGGWDSFGIERLVTSAKGNILYKLDNVPALAIYKSFLGEKSKDLPSSALLFPLSLRTELGQPPVVRTILGINEEEQSMTFAGNIPQGSYVRLMKANMDRLIEGATIAAQNCKQVNENTPSLSLLISCIGRKLVLKQLVEEEVEAVQDVLGKTTTITGFYSYGEICPFSSKLLSCELHNQTMTITSFVET